MELDIFGLLDKTESQARFFFKKYCWKNGRVFCPRCRSCKIYRIINKRYRCKGCGYTFHDFSNRWINKLNISFKQWMWLIKLFELELSTRRIADQVRLSYPTVLKAVTVLRVAIFINDKDTDEFLQDELNIDDIYFEKRHGKRNANVSNNKTPLIGILKKDGMVRVKCIRCDDVELRLQNINENNKIESIGYDTRFKNYNYLMYCDYKSLKIGHGRSSSNGKCSMNGLESFLSYARERLLKFHGISRERFLLYMKEMEFRYNHRHDDLFILFAQDLCTLLPFQMPNP